MKKTLGLTASVAFVLALASIGCVGSGPYIAQPDRLWQLAEPPSPDLETHRIYLVGDAGDQNLDVPNHVIAAIRASVQGSDVASTVAFLGDNIYCCGLPDSAAENRDQAERILRRQMEAVADLDARVVVIPGNHDWNNSKPGGLDAVRRQQVFVDSLLGRRSFFPRDGFPGPNLIDVEDDLAIIAIDTEWWLTKQEKAYGDTGEYEIDEDLDFLVALEDAVANNDDKTVVVLGHHPTRSIGRHAGHYPPKTHLFPLSTVTDAILPGYLPLPVFGTLYILAARSFGGSRQDLASGPYRTLRRGLERIFGQHEALVYAAGHAHSLQLHQVGQPGLQNVQHHVVSGGGSRPEYVARGSGATYTHSSLGYATLHHYRNGSLWVSFWSVNDEGRATLEFRKELVKGTPRRTIPTEAAVASKTVDYSDSTLTVPINPDYAAGPVKRFFLGSHHREDWATPVEVPVLDLGKTAGGLTPVKRGGGMQTISLRLKGADGKEYVLRSLDKDPSGTVPVNLQGTIATDIVQDQIASIHPYGAFMIPPLAEEAGVYYTRPRLVYVPDDPRLGQYRQKFANQVMMLEHRPDGDVSDMDNYGNSNKVVSAHRMYEEINADNDNRVDPLAFVRVRLFDMMLSDWDRHRDQWRWSSFDDDDGKGTVYRPIPRDRDWAFNQMNGLFPSLVKFADPKFQSFRDSYGVIKGLTTNGLEQDRRFTAMVTRDQWIEIAEDLRDSISDEAIDEAVRNLPPPIYERSGVEIARTLRVRRDKLPQVAAEYYEILARVVDVVGSNKHERFEIHRLDNRTTEVVVYKTSKEGEVRQEIFRRTFLNNETDEIRLFGLEGNDQFVLDGEVGKGVHIIAVGGSGDDSFNNSSNVRGPRKKARFIDTDAGSTVEAGKDTHVSLTSDPVLNAYDSGDYKHNVLLPQVYFGQNSDDGLFIGGGILKVNNGFRRIPYANSHRLVGNIAARTRAFNVSYEGRVTEVFGAWGVSLDAGLLSPNNIRNFYGLGNETENTEDDRTFYQARLTRALLKPALFRGVGSNVTVTIGPKFEVTQVREDEDRFIVQDPGVSDQTFDDQWFTGGDVELEVDLTDQPSNPRQGFRWFTRGQVNVGVRNTKDNFAKISSDLSLFGSLSMYPQFTVALRAGVEHVAGDFPFYEASTLGGKSNLRGHRSTRFAGRTSLYQNAELRAKVFDFKSYLAIGDIGILAFVDNGRVWTDDESSREWHQGYGGGLWAHLFRQLTLASWVGISDDETAFTLTFGFQY